MNLHQMNASFDAHEDRLLLKVSTEEAQEFRFWLTRRMVTRIWPRIMTVLESAPTPANKPLAAIPLEFRHAAAVEQADFATPYEAATRVVVQAAEPMLVSKFSLSTEAVDRYVMTLASQRGASFTLGFGAPLLHGFIKLVQDTAVKAEWGVSLQVPSATMASAAIN